MDKPRQKRPHWAYTVSVLIVAFGMAVWQFTLGNVIGIGLWALVVIIWFAAIAPAYMRPKGPGDA